MCVQQQDGNCFHRMLRIEVKFKFRTDEREALNGWGDEYWQSRSHLRGVFLAVALWMAATLCSSAATWYVSNSGKDSNSGTNVAGPLQHIQAAVNRAAYGDTVNVQAGTYREQVEIDS